MEEVVEGGFGTVSRTSPRRAAIQKVQAELRQEFDVREERRRELEFLEKGGNPLDFNFGSTASVSVQSTSFTDQHPVQLVTSEAKGSFAFTASLRCDSVESSGRPEVPPCGPNSADNHLLFDAEQEFSGVDRNRLHLCRTNILQTELSSQIYGSDKAPINGDSTAYSPPRKAYKRRNRSRPNRDGTRSSSNDINLSRGSHGSSLSSLHAPGDVKGLISDADQNIPSSCNSKPTSPADCPFHKTVVADVEQDTVVDGLQAVKSTRDLIDSVLVDTASDAIASRNPSIKMLSGAAKSQIEFDSVGSEATQAMGEMDSEVNKCQAGLTSAKVENQANSFQRNGFSCKKSDGMINDACNSCASFGIKSLDFESSCTETVRSVDRNNDSEMCTKMQIVDSKTKNRTSVRDRCPAIEVGGFIHDNKDTAGKLVTEESTSACHLQKENGFTPESDKELDKSESSLKADMKDQSTIEAAKDCDPAKSDSQMKPIDRFDENSVPKHEISCNGGHQDLTGTAVPDLPEAGMSNRVSTVSMESQTYGSDLKLENKVDEESILREAEMIEVKRKRILKLSMVTSPKEIHCHHWRSHWDYVLEEMAWLANDFAQERLWKIAAAAQVSSRVASACRLRKQEKASSMSVKKVAHTLAQAVMEFWHSVEESSNPLDRQSQKEGGASVQAYAVRFLKYNDANIFHDQAVMPLTPDRISDSGILDLSQDDGLAEDNLFYTILPGAMGTYRKSIESHVDICKRISGSAQKEGEISACDTAADCDSQDDGYDEDEGETSTYGMILAFKGSNSSGFGQKKRRHLMHASDPRSYGTGSDLLSKQCGEQRVVTQQPFLPGKRMSSNLNSSVPTKRVRTASRRVVSTSSPGASGCIQLANKRDASSGDASSYQDDQSTLHGGLHVPNTCDLESVGDFEKQLLSDSAEVSTKPKKQKKAKHLNVGYEQRWQVDSGFPHEQVQRNHWKRRAETHQFESNGSSGLLGSHVIKKPKVIRQSHDDSCDNITRISGSLPSPAASQMSNMSNPNNLIKMLGGRDRSRKSKSLKVLAGQPSSGNTWSKFEEQALIVLAHDLGPNWELVSDALNSTLRFKCIFRKPKECKERHDVLTDRTSGDGVDSAEDSGSSQPYPSTLPGIPKGSARQLFQHLQGPVEEETLKSHFEKIIKIEQKQHCRKAQDPKQLQLSHASHTTALSQVFPNNLNRERPLTPLDLSDDSNSAIDMVYQEGPSKGLAIMSQDAATQMFPASPSPFHSSIRDSRYVSPQSSSSLPADERQRMQQYNHIVANRNIPQSHISAPEVLPATDIGARTLPVSTSMGIVSGGVNRSMPMVRSRLPETASSSLVNSGSMVSPVVTPANIHSGIGSGQASSVLRSREALHMIRPTLSQDSQRQIVGSDLQMSGNSQGVPYLGGTSSSFPNQNGSQPVSPYSIHHQQLHPMSPQQQKVLSPRNPQFQGPINHVLTPQQQAYAFRIAKERQMQHRFLQQQQQQQRKIAPSNSLIPHVQTQAQSSPVHNSSQVHSQSSSQVPLSPASTTSSMNSKHPTQVQGPVQNVQAGGDVLTSQMVNKRQRQQQQSSRANRQPTQQRQQSQAQLQGKITKGVGRGNLMMDQNIPKDPSLLNGISTSPGNQCLEKGEPAHLVQGQSTSTGLAPHAVRQSRQHMSTQPSNQSLPQQMMCSVQGSPKGMHQKTSPSGNSSQEHISPVAPGLSGIHKSVPSLAMGAANHQQSSSYQRLMNQNHLEMQGVVPPIHLMKSDVNQNQLETKGVLPPIHQKNSDVLNQPQARVSNPQHPTNSCSEIDTMPIVPQQCSRATNVMHVASACPPQWHPSDPLVDTDALHSVAILSSAMSTPSNSCESVPQAGEGPGQRPSAGIPPIKHDVSVLWQQQSSQGSQPHLPGSQSPQQAPLQHQQSLAKVHSYQQVQLLQEGNGSSYGRSNDPRLG